MHLSAFTDSEVEDKQILHIKSEQMLPEVPDLIAFYLFIRSLKLYCYIIRIITLFVLL